MALDYIRRVAGPFSGAGTAELPFGFYCYDEGDIAVVMAESDSTTEVTWLVSGTDFTVTLNDDQDVSPGGTVTLADALADDSAVVVVISAMEYTQETELTNYSRFPPTILNDSLDRIVVQTQQLFEAIGRCLKVPLTYNATPEEFMQLLFDARDEAVQAAEDAEDSANEAASSAEAAANSATEAANSASVAAASAEEAATSATNAALSAVTEFPYIVETLEDVEEHEQENGYFWVTGVTTESGNTATTLAENLDAINTVIANLDALLSLSDNAEALLAVDDSLLTIDDLTTVFEAGLSS